MEDEREGLKGTVASWSASVEVDASRPSQLCVLVEDLSFEVDQCEWSVRFTGDSQEFAICY